MIRGKTQKNWKNGDRKRKKNKQNTYIKRKQGFWKNKRRFRQTTTQKKNYLKEEEENTKELKNMLKQCKKTFLKKLFSEILQPRLCALYDCEEWEKYVKKDTKFLERPRKRRKT